MIYIFYLQYDVFGVLFNSLRIDQKQKQKKLKHISLSTEKGNEIYLKLNKFALIVCNSIQCISAFGILLSIQENFIGEFVVANHYN